MTSSVSWAGVPCPLPDPLPPLPAKPRAIVPGEALVYFVRVGDEGPVKIGTTRNLGVRLGRLQIGNHRRLKLLGVYPGDRRLEKHLHRVFDAHHIGGEWFRPAAEIRQMAKAAAAHLLQPSYRRGRLRAQTVASDHGQDEPALGEDV